MTEHENKVLRQAARACLTMRDRYIDVFRRDQLGYVDDKVKV